MDLSSESERRSLPPHVTYRDHQARLLEDGETIHNAFFDRSFRMGPP